MLKDHDKGCQNTATPGTEPAPELRGELLTVIVPCLNEVDNVRATAESILNADVNVALEIVFIDDGSSDGTREVMEELCSEDPRCRMIVNEATLGLGQSVLRSYEQIDDRSWATVIPGDNEFIFDSIENFLAVRDDHDVILGYLQNPVIRTLGRRLASDSFTKIANFLYGFDFRYFNGMKMYRVSCFKNIPTVSTGHAFNPELLAKAMLRNPNLRVGEAGFLIKGRAHGGSKAFTVRAVAQALRDMYRGYRAVVRYREKTIRGQGADNVGAT